MAKNHNKNILEASQDSYCFSVSLIWTLFHSS